MSIRHAAVLAATVVLFVEGRSLVAQGVLAQLGLTETSARNFVINEVKSPATERTSGTVITGTRRRTRSVVTSVPAHFSAFLMF